MQKRRVVFFGHYGLPNWGDEAILAGLLTRFDRKLWDIRVFSPFPERVSREHKVRALPPPAAGIRSFCREVFRGNFFQTLRTLKKADLVIFGGGGLFQVRPQRAFRIWSRYLQICLKYKKSVVLLANSFGPFSSPSQEQKLGKLFTKVKFLSVRDAPSHAFLKTIAIPKEKRRLATDAALLLEKTKKTERSAGILVSLRREDLSSTARAELKALCKKFQENKEKIWFLPLQSLQTQDERLAKELGIPLLKPTNLRQVRTLFAKSKFVLTNRLHGGILALLEATPFLALASRPKIENFFRSAGLSEFLFLNTLAVEPLLKKITNLMKNKKSVQLKLRQKLLSERQKTELIFPDFLS